VSVPASPGLRPTPPAVPGRTRATSRTSPSSDRTLQILDFLAAHPEERFSFSELRRSLGMSSGTMHALLASLVNASYVRRNPKGLTYALGPAALALGAAARTGYHLADDLVPGMEVLSSQLELTCHATVAQHDEMVVIARSGPPEPFGRRVRVGERYPLAPPLGTAYVAWSEPAAIDAYLARSNPPLSPGDLERCRLALRRVRQRGYSIALDPATRHRVGELMDREPGTPAPVGPLAALLSQLAHEEYLVGDLSVGSEYDVVAITTPVFGPDGSVLGLLSLANFPGPVAADAIPRLAARLRSTADAATGTRRAGRNPIEDRAEEVS
jgi:DNA-binding IclR family transcriptional regulator